MDRQTSLASEETMQVLQDLSQLLNTGLDKNQLKACVELIENGINAEAVAKIVQNLREEALKEEARKAKVAKLGS